MTEQEKQYRKILRMVDKRIDWALDPEKTPDFDSSYECLREAQRLIEELKGKLQVATEALNRMNNQVLDTGLGLVKCCNILRQLTISTASPQTN